MANEPTGADFESRLATAKAEGMTGREELLEKLARMPMDKVIALPASSLAILGPQGLAQLAAKREDLAGTARRVPGRSARPQPAPDNGYKVGTRARPVRSAVVVVLAILTAGLLADVARPALVHAIFHPGVRSRQTSRWPACRRLDHYTDGCVYTAGGANLSLARVAMLTRIPVDQVADANGHLSVAPQIALPQGSRIVIWRGYLKLAGAAQ